MIIITIRAIRISPSNFLGTKFSLRFVALRCKAQKRRGARSTVLPLICGPWEWSCALGEADPREMPLRKEGFSICWKSMYIYKCTLYIHAKICVYIYIYIYKQIFLYILKQKKGSLSQLGGGWCSVYHWIFHAQLYSIIFMTFPRSDWMHQRSWRFRWKFSPFPTCSFRRRTVWTVRSTAIPHCGARFMTPSHAYTIHM